MAGVVIRHEALRVLARQMLAETGSAADVAATVADHLVDANPSGHDSHGVGLLRCMSATGWRTTFTLTGT
jgi:uncharacterized oxidoreductase